MSITPIAPSPMHDSGGSKEQSSIKVLSIGTEWQTEAAGGVNRYTGGLANAFLGIGLSQQWIVVGNDPSAERINITAAAAPTTNLPSRLLAVRNSAKMLRSEADLIATHFALYAAPALSACKSLPHVCHFHGPWAAESAVEGSGRLSVIGKRWLERHVYRSADRVITLSRAFATIASNDYGVDEDRIRTIPGGVEVERWAVHQDRQSAREQLGWPTDRAIVVCVRRLARRMGIENLIDAAKTLREKVPDLLVLIGGGGPLKQELTKRIEESGLNETVRLLGFVPEEELALAYRAADLSIVPTQALEGFGLIVLESLASGTPALVSPVGGLPEVVEDFAPQLVLESSSTESITEGIAQALRGKLSLPSSDECQQYVLETYAWPIIAKKILKVYQEVLR